MGGRRDAGGRRLNGVRTDEVPDVRLSLRRSFLNWPPTAQRNWATPIANEPGGARAIPRGGRPDQRLAARARAGRAPGPPAVACDADGRRAVLGDHLRATTLRNVCETEGERLCVALADFVLRASEHSCCSQRTVVEL